MEAVIYYVFFAMLLGGALGVVLMPGYVNAAMSMLVSMLGAAGMMLMMGAYFPAFVMVSVYAGAVLVLFVFVVMLVGERGGPAPIGRKMGFLALWVAMGVLVGFYSPEIAGWASAAGDGALAKSAGEGALETAKNYGLAMVGRFMLPFQIAGLMLLAAMVGVVVIAKEPAAKKRRRELV